VIGFQRLVNRMQRCSSPAPPRIYQPYPITEQSVSTSQNITAEIVALRTKQRTFRNNNFLDNKTTGYWLH